MMSVKTTISSTNETEAGTIIVNVSTSTGPSVLLGMTDKVMVAVIVMVDVVVMVTLVQSRSTLPLTWSKKICNN